MRSFLRPNPRHAALAKRVTFAKNYLAGEFDGAGCVSVHRTTGDKLSVCPRTDL